MGWLKKLRNSFKNKPKQSSIKANQNNSNHSQQQPQQQQQQTESNINNSESSKVNDSKIENSKSSNLKVNYKNNINNTTNENSQKIVEKHNINNISDKTGDNNVNHANFIDNTNNDQISSNWNTNSMKKSRKSTKNTKSLDENIDLVANTIVDNKSDLMVNKNSNFDSNDHKEPCMKRTSTLSNGQSFAGNFIIDNMDEYSIKKCKKRESFGTKFIRKFSITDSKSEKDFDEKYYKYVKEYTNCKCFEYYQKYFQLNQLYIPTNIRHPKLIHLKANNDPNKGSVADITKKCEKCIMNDSFLIHESFNDEIFKDLIIHLKSSNNEMKSLEIYLSGSNTIKGSLRSFENFSKLCCKHLQSFHLLTDHWSLSRSIVFNNVISCTFYQLFYLNSENFKNLNDIEILLTNSNDFLYFQKFWEEFRSQIERLAIKIRHNFINFNSYAKEIFGFIAKKPDKEKNFDLKLKSLRIDLIPISEQSITNDKFNIESTFRSIELCTKSIQKNIEKFSLIINITYVDTNKLQLMEFLSKFDHANHYDLIILHDFNDHNVKLRLNFMSLSSIKSLKSFNLNYYGLKSIDLDQLSHHVRQIQELQLYFDDKLDKTVYSLINYHMKNLKTLSLGPSLNSYLSTSKKHKFYFDNNSLQQLLIGTNQPNSLELTKNTSKPLTSLRTIQLMNGHIHFRISTSHKTNEKKAAFTLLGALYGVTKSIANDNKDDPNESMFRLILINNCYELPDAKTLHESFQFSPNFSLEKIYKSLN